MTTTVTCEQCGKTFTGRTKRRRFCDECKRERHRELSRRYTFFGKDQTENRKKWYAAHTDYNRQYYLRRKKEQNL